MNYNLIFKGKANTRRKAAYREIVEETGLDESLVREIFHKGARFMADELEELSRRAVNRIYYLSINEQPLGDSCFTNEQQLIAEVRKYREGATNIEIHTSEWGLKTITFLDEGVEVEWDISILNVINR